MALWDDLREGVALHTKRPDLSALTDAALRQAIRTAHKSGKYWRDLIKVTVAPESGDVIQQFNISSQFTRFRQIAYIKNSADDFWYRPADISDLVDDYGYAKTDIYYGIGTKLLIRASVPQEQYEVCYYQHPVVSPPSSVISWIAEEYSDVVILWAASTVLSAIGEQEIKQRIDQLALIAFADLQQDNIEIFGR